MQAANAASMIELWERGEHCSAAQRALVLLAWALPDRDIDTLADWDLGLRDWHLLRLRRALHGPQLDGYTDCPACGERLEIELDARQLQGDVEPSPAPEHRSEQWPFDFDPAGFVWEEIRADALQLLDEVHQLASAYRWSERAILAMSATRRAAYLARIG